MSKIANNTTKLQNILNKVNALPEAGGGGGEPTHTQEKSIDITENGTVVVTPDDGYALSKVTANVNVPIPSGYIKPSGTKSITENGTHDAKAYESVSVNVPIPDGYIVPSGTLDVTENGIHDVTAYMSINVNVSEREIVLQDKTITENGTYTADDGYDGIGQVTVNVASSGDESTNTEWFADLITDSARTIEVYNDKFTGTLSAYAFYERANVTKIELPNLQYLKERCFYGCQNLKTLLLPGLVGYTYQYMASGCSKLENVDIHDTNYVSSYTFQNCTSLKKVDLHKVGTIATNAFNGATKLETLIIRTDTVPTLGGTNAFTNTKIKSGGTGYIYVKSALLNDFKSATNWSSLSSQFRASEDYPEITGG